MLKCVLKTQKLIPFFSVFVENQKLAHYNKTPAHVLKHKNPTGFSVVSNSIHLFEHSLTPSLSLRWDKN